MASIPTGGITIDNLPSASGVNDTDAVIISRSGKAYKTTAIAEQINTLNADLTELEGVAPSAGTDLNDYIGKTGLYYFGSSETPDNIPEGSNGWLLVLKSRDNYSVTKQFWFRHGTPSSNDYQTFVRTCNNSGEWGDWWRFAMESDLNSDSMAKNLGQISDISDLASAMDDAGTYNYVFFTMGSSLRSTLTNGDNTSTSFAGTACKTSSTQYGYMIHSYSTIYTGRFTSDGSVTYCYKFSGERIQTNSITPSDTGEPVVMGEDDAVED